MFSNDSFVDPLPMNSPHDRLPNGTCQETWCFLAWIKKLSRIYMSLIQCLGIGLPIGYLLFEQRNAGSVIIEAAILVQKRASKLTRNYIPLSISKELELRLRSFTKCQEGVFR